MPRAPAYRSGPSRLVWNQVSPDEWQAGGLTRTYSVTRRVDGEWSASVCIAESHWHFGAYSSLGNAQRRCQGHLSGRHVADRTLPRTGKEPKIIRCGHCR